MASLLSWAAERLAALRAAAAPPPTHSDLASGYLTPGEFIAAGDALVAAAPSWQWAAGEPALRKAYLPPGKQHLLTRGVPCRARAAVGCAHAAALLLGAAPDSAGFERVDVVTSCGGDGGGFEQLALQDAGCGEPADPAADMAPAEGQRAPPFRRYDVSIVYEPWFRTPALFLAGFSHHAGVAARTALTPTELLEDVVASYAADTATVTAHPHVGAAHEQQAWVRVHPCKHAAAMRLLLAATAAEGEDGGGGDSGGGGGGGGGGEPLGAAAGAAATAAGASAIPVCTAAGAAPTGTGASASAAGATHVRQQQQQVVDPERLLQAYLPTFLKLMSSMLPTVELDFTS